MSILYAISEIGLVIYMFLIGLELNTKLLKHHIKSASLLSAAGIITPFILGAIAALINARGLMELIILKDWS